MQRIDDEGRLLPSPRENQCRHRRLQTIDEKNSRYVVEWEIRIPIIDRDVGAMDLLHFTEDNRSHCAIVVFSVLLGTSFLWSSGHLPAQTLSLASASTSADKTVFWGNKRLGIGGFGLGAQ